MRKSTKILDIAAELGMSCSDCVYEALAYLGYPHLGLHDKLPRTVRTKFKDYLDAIESIEHGESEDV